MSTSRLRQKYILLKEELLIIKNDIFTLDELIQNVNYTASEKDALINVGTRYTKEVVAIDEELFAISQLIEVEATIESMEQNSAMH